MLNKPSANSATHPSQIFLRIHPCSNNSKTRLEAFVYALTWNGLGLDFLRDSTKPFGWFSDSFTQVAKWKRKRLLSSPKNLFMKPTPFFRHFAICEYAKQAHISGYSHHNTFCGACANKMPICYLHLKWYVVTLLARKPPFFVQCPLSRTRDVLQRFWFVSGSKCEILQRLW